MDPTKKILIGDWTVRPALNLLERDGRAIRIEPLAMELLVYLAGRSGEVVSADELIRDLWHGRVFDDGVVYRKIHQLRKVLGNDSRVARFIETIPKRGYRLIASVTVLADEQDGSRNMEELPAESVQASVTGSAHALAESRTDAVSSHSMRSHSRRLAFAAIALVAVLALLLAGNLLAPRGPPIGDHAAVDPRSAGSASQLPAPRQLTFGGGLNLHPRISPDGRYVAFTSSRDDPANLDIYVKPIGSDAGFVRVTRHPAADRFPTWSPDGNRIAFVRDDQGSLSIHTVPVPWVGGQAQKVVDVLGYAYHWVHTITTLSWSPPDGRYLLYGERPPDTPARIVRFDLQERRKTVLSDATLGDAIGDFWPSYSPDGKSIAFVRGPVAGVGNLDLWLMDADGNNERRITRLHMVEVEGIAWTPDSRELFFPATRGDPFKLRTYSINLNEGEPRLVPGLGLNDRWPSIAGNRLVFARYGRDLRLWQVPARSEADHSTPARSFGIDGIKVAFSPLGNRIAWQSGEGGSVQIWVADWDGRNHRNPRAVTDVALAMDPQWSPDGKLVVFISVEPTGLDVYVVDPDTLQQRRLTEHEKNDYAPTFSHDGRWIYFCSTRQDEPQIYKMPLEGERAAEPIRVTRDGGCTGYVSREGRYLYYEQFDLGKTFPIEGPIWRLSLGSDDAPVEVLPSWPRPDRSWVLADNGIYWVDGLGVPSTLNYFDFSSGTSSEVHRDDARGGAYPSVSPDESVVVMTKETPPQSDLYVIEDFR